MKKINLILFNNSNIILFVSVLFAAFILPMLPVFWHRGIFRIVYSVIYISAILSLKKKSTNLIILFASTLLLEWVSGIFDLSVLLTVSRGVNVLFFIVIVAFLIKQIASAKVVSAWVILDSIVGYLLLGIIYSILISVMLQLDPDSFSNMQISSTNINIKVNISTPLYYSYVSLASLGYGDIVPLKPYSRSLATFITISGQFYITIIVALLVGKYSSNQTSKSNDNE